MDILSAFGIHHAAADEDAVVGADEVENPTLNLSFDTHNEIEEESPDFGLAVSLANNYLSGDFADAVGIARRDHKFLLAIVYSSFQISSTDLCANLLTNEFLQQTLQQFVVWTADVASGLAQSLQDYIDRTPALASQLQPFAMSIIANRGVIPLPFLLIITVESSSVTVLETLAGVSVDAIIPALWAVSENHGQALEENRLRQQHQKQRYSETAELLREQDRELEEAQAADMKRRLEREKVQQEAEMAEAIRLSQEQAAEEVAKRVLERKAFKRQSLAPEPPKSDQTTTIQFRLPDGSKLQRIFARSKTIRDVVDYLDATWDALKDPSAVELSTTFPKRTYTLTSDATTRLDDQQLHPQVVLNVFEKTGK